MARSADRLHTGDITGTETRGFNIPLPRIKISRRFAGISLALAIAAGAVGSGYAAGFDPAQMFKGDPSEKPAPHPESTMYLPDLLKAARPDLETVSQILEQARREKETARIAAEVASPKPAIQAPESNTYLPQILKDAKVDSETAGHELRAAQRAAQTRLEIQAIPSESDPQMTPIQIAPGSEAAKKLKELEANMPNLSTYLAEREQIIRNNSVR